MTWNKTKLENHMEAARLLGIIKNKAFAYIAENKTVTEYEVMRFILKQFKAKGLRTHQHNAIVAFRQNTGYIHYYPSQYCLKLKPETLIMLDLWARLDKPNSPYADITWVGYYGKKVPKEIAKVFAILINAREASLSHLKKSLKQGRQPTGWEVDEAGRSVIEAAGMGKRFPHGTGHSLGMEAPHGQIKGIRPQNDKPLKKNMGYTIEPGIYFEKKFGVRSEIDVYIDNKLDLTVTTKKQKEIILL